MTKTLLALLAAAPLATASAADSAAAAVNALGLELFGRSAAPGQNTALSPFSIQTALVMAWAGARGETRDQMASVLHVPDDAVDAFSRLQAQVLRVPEEVSLSVANRLFGQTGYEFRPAYLALVKDKFGAPLEPLDFRKSPTRAADHINAWVEKQTHDRIRQLIPQDGLSKETGLVLVNALYLKAPWMEAFPERATRPLPFHLAAGKPANVPTMVHEAEFGYRKASGHVVVTVPYVGDDLQFVIVLPDEGKELAALEKSLGPSDLAGWTKVPDARVRLFLPKFKLEPPRFALGETLQALGMKAAFDVPPGSADFDGIAPRLPNDYLYISEVFHKAFMEIDEAGTEAAAATAIVMMRATAMPVKQPEPVEVRVDRPFLFAIQHRPTGACLFLGRVADPRQRHRLVRKIGGN